MKRETAQLYDLQGNPMDWAVLRARLWLYGTHQQASRRKGSGKARCITITEKGRQVLAELREAQVRKDEQSAVPDAIPGAVGG